MSSLFSNEDLQQIEKAKILRTMIDKSLYENSFRYIDAHIIKDNKLVGVFALEEILRLSHNKDIARSLFVNTKNSVNYEMESRLQKLVSEVFGIKNFTYNCSEYNPNAQTDEKIFYMSRTSANQPITVPSFYQLNNPDTVYFINWDMILDTKKAK